MANRKIKLGAMVLFALVSAAPAQAVDFDWFQSLFGVGSGGGHPGVDPVANTTGVGSGGGDPGVEPVVRTSGTGGGGGDPTLKKMQLD